MRVALVSGGLKLGGSTTFLCNLAGELVRRRIHMEVLSFELDNPLKSEQMRLRRELQGVETRVLSDWFCA